MLNLPLELFNLQKIAKRGLVVSSARDHLSTEHLKMMSFLVVGWREMVYHVSLPPLEIFYIYMYGKVILVLYILGCPILRQTCLANNRQIQHGHRPSYPMSRAWTLIVRRLSPECLNIQPMVSPHWNILNIHMFVCRGVAGSDLCKNQQPV